MTYGFKDIPIMPRTVGDVLIATALDGVVYTENGRVHVKGNAAHYVYKPEGSPVGWYARNKNTFDDIYLGVGASPTMQFESLEIKNTNAWALIEQKDPENTDEENEAQVLNAIYIPDVASSANALLMVYLNSNPLNNDDDKLKVSGLYKDWELGSYDVGDIRNHGGQTWECWTAHDNAIYPDITPDNPQTWANFWRPLHGKTAATARPWVKPQYGTTDMYHAGEYMVYTDGNTYECVSDTVYSPDEYAQAWRVVGEASEPDGGEGGESDGEEDVQEPSTEEYPAWVQPTGAHDAYAQGAKVSHNGKKWTSYVTNNVWEPGVYGWTEVQ